MKNEKYRLKLMEVFPTRESVRATYEKRQQRREKTQEKGVRHEQRR